MNMRKLLLSLMAIVGLMNSICCASEVSGVVTEEELNENNIYLLIKNEVIGSPEFLAVEQALEWREYCIRKRIQVFNRCSSQGNCKESVELRSAIDEYNAAHNKLEVTAQQLQLKVAQQLKLEPNQVEKYLGEAIICASAFK